MTNKDIDKLLYTYPDGKVLRNKLNTQNQETLDKAERLYVPRRIQEGVPEGNYDLKHLQDIHKHLFQDLFDWAGELRKVDISKGGNWFMPHDRIEFAMVDVESRIKKNIFSQSLTAQKFSVEAGIIIGDINMIHPFREGNGRTQMAVLSQLSQQAGYEIDLTKIDKDEWLEASIDSHAADYTKMQECIAKSLVGKINKKDKENGKSKS